MRVAIVHSYYTGKSPSGENAMVDMSAKMLVEAGHEVAILDRRTDDLSGSMLYKLSSGLRVATGRGSDPSESLRRFAPDIVHVHNLFPNYGTRWLIEWKSRLISTLHNYRPVCANGLLFRDGEICMECPEGSSISAFKHACYRESRLATLPLVVRNRRGAGDDPVISASRRIIVLSRAAMKLYEGFGVPRQIMTVLPNGVSSAPQRTSSDGNGRWLVVGRLSSEKGIAKLAATWPTAAQLDIVGDGPDAAVISKIGHPGIRLLGLLPRDELLNRMSNYQGLVFPSMCLEMQPTVVIEAMSVGLPVVALRGNAGADLVEIHGAGRTYTGAHDLESALSTARASRTAIGEAGRRAYEDHYLPEEWLAGIQSLYTRVSNEASKDGDR